MADPSSPAEENEYFSTSTQSQSQPHSQQQQQDRETLSPLEQELLDEYAALVGNLNHMSALLTSLIDTPTASVLDALRGLERKTSLVYTLMKASVYNVYLDRQGEVEGEGEGQTMGMGVGGDSMVG